MSAVRPLPRSNIDDDDDCLHCAISRAVQLHFNAGDNPNDAANALAQVIAEVAKSAVPEEHEQRFVRSFHALVDQHLANTQRRAPSLN